MIKKNSLIIFLGLIIISASFCLEFSKLLEKSNNAEILPLFNLEIPVAKSLFFNKKSSINSASILSQNISQEIKVIIHLKDPSKVWPNEVASMGAKDVKNLKTVMRDYIIGKIDLSKVENYYYSFNGFSAELSYENYLLLLTNPLIESITEDEKVIMNLDESTEIIGAAKVWDYSIGEEYITGKGQTICVIDTGIDYTHFDLGACSIGQANNNESYSLAPFLENNYTDNYNNFWNITKTGYDEIAVYFDYINIERRWDYIYIYDKNDILYGTYTGIFTGWSNIIPGDTIKIQFVTDISVNGSNGYSGFSISAISDDLGYNWSNCNKVIGGYDFANNDYNPLDDNGHGTHVAGIVAAKGLLKGVAPDANLVAVKVLDSEGSGDKSDVLAGIEYCISNAEEYNISVISMSLGGYISYNNYCDDTNEDYSLVINAAAAKNISVVIATGNNYEDYPYDGVSSPACIYNATRVGSSLKSDSALSSFSNRWALDMLVAPGSSIYSTYKGSYNYLSGTSMATPHVSGAIALINQYYSKKNETISPKEINIKLNQTGKIINHDGRDYSRIDLVNYFSTLDVIKYSKVTIDYPQEYFYSHNIFSVSADNFELSTAYCYFYLNNSFIGSSQVINSESILDYTFSEGFYFLMVICNDSYGNESTATSYFASNYPPLLLNISANESVIEGQNVTVISTWNNELYGNINDASLFIALNYFNESMPINYWDYNYQYEIISEGSIDQVIFNYDSSGYAGQNLSFGISVYDNYGNNNQTYDSDLFYYNNSDNLLYNLSFYNLITTYVEDNESPQINLNYPYNNSYVSNPIFFNFDIIDNNRFDSLNCSFYLNEKLNQSISGVYSSYYFELDLNEGAYNWSVSCMDISGNPGNSITLPFYVNAAPILLNSSINDFVNEHESIIINLTFDNGLYGNVNSIHDFFIIENYNNDFSYYNNITSYYNMTNTYNFTWNYYQTNNTRIDTFINSSNNFYYPVNHPSNYNDSSSSGLDTTVYNYNLVFNNNTYTQTYSSINENYTSYDIISFNNYTWYFDSNYVADFVQNNSLSYFYLNYPTLENQIGKNITFIFDLNDDSSGQYKNYIINSSEIYSYYYDHNENNYNECYSSSQNCTMYYNNHGYSEEIINNFYYLNPIFTVYVKDITPPTLNLVHFPEYSTNTSKIITFNVSDNVGFKQVNCSLYLNDNYNQSKLVYPNSSQQYFNLNLAEGEYNYSVKCVDYDLNQANQSYKITIDTTAPKVSISSPLNNEVVNSTIAIQANISDINLANVSLIVDGVVFKTKSENYSYFYYPTILLNDSIHSFKLLATDLAGNINSSSINLTISNTVPVLLNVSGNFSQGLGSLNSTNFIGTVLESIIEEITGLNSLEVIIQAVNTSSTNLSNTLGALNITASTSASSTVKFMIPKSILQRLGLTANYSSIIVFAVHSNGDTEELNATYEGLVIIEEIEFERFKFTTTHFSTFYYGIDIADPTCSDGIMNQGETGVDCGGPCSACYVAPPSSPPSSPRISGGILIGVNNKNNETILNTSKTFEFVNNINETISKELEINKSLTINISGLNYSFEISSMNSTYIYLNISNYGLLKLFVGAPKNISLNNVNFSIMLESLVSGVANVSFETLSAPENIEEELEISPITANIALQNIEEKDTKLIGYIILIITGIAAAILLVLKIFRIL